MEYTVTSKTVEAITIVVKDVRLQTGLNRDEALFFKESERLWLTNEAYKEHRKIKPYRPYISIQA